MHKIGVDGIGPFKVVRQWSECVIDKIKSQMKEESSSPPLKLTELSI